MICRSSEIQNEFFVVKIMRVRLTKKSSLIGIFLLLFVGGGLFYYQTAQGVNRTWDGGGTDGTCGGGAGDGNKWSCAANWSGDVAPGASDIAVFDTTSTKDVTIASNISVAGISINAGYTGTITQTSTFTVTVGSSHYSQADGTFTGGSGTIDINGTFTLSGGTFTSTSGTLEVGRGSSSETVFTQSAGTFNHNNGTVTFVSIDSGNNGNVFTVDVATTLTLYNIVVDCSCFTGSSGLVTATGDTIIASNDFTHTNGALYGAWETQGNVIIGSGADGGDGTLTMTGTGSKTYTYSSGGTGPHLRVNNASISVSANTGTTDLKTSLFSLLAGSFTAPTGTFSIGRQRSSSETFFTVSSGTTFNNNNGIVNLVPNDSTNNGALFTLDVNTSLTFYDAIVNCVTACGTGVTTAAGDTIIVSNNFTHTNGVLKGTWEVQGNYTVATTADGGTAGITFTGGNNQTYTDQGGSETDGDVTINKSGGTVTLASGADWNATNQDLTITAGTLDASTFNITTTNFTVNGGTFTGGSGTVTTSGPFNMSSGTFTGGAGNVLIGTTYTLSGGTFTAPSGNLQIPNNFTHTAGGTFNHNNGTVTFTGFFTTTDVSTSETFYNLILNHSSGYIHTIASGDTLVVLNTFTQSQGGFNTGTIEARGNVVINAAQATNTGTLTFLVAGDQTITSTSGNTGKLYIAKSSGTVSLTGDLTILNDVEIVSGTFTSTSGTLTLSGNWIHTAGGTFNHNNGTVVMTVAFNSTPDVTSSISSSGLFYNLTKTNTGNLTLASGDIFTVQGTFTHTDGTVNTGTINAQGNVVIATTADGGSGFLSFTGGSNQVYTDQGGNEPDGDVAINKTPGSSVTLASNADWNAASQDVTITSGELNMGASYNLSTTALTVATNGHLSNYGTGDLTLAGNVSNSGNIRFRSNGTCGGTDSISIASSSAGVQRTWSGSGTYLFHDVTVQDQGGSAAITAYSSTSVSGNGVNWTFSGAACPSVPPAAGLSTGKINVTTGKLNLR